MNHIISAGLGLTRKLPSHRVCGGVLALSWLVCSAPLALAQITNVGHALYFDGTTNAVVSTSGLQGFPSANITVEFWARSTNTSKAGSLFSYGAGEPNTFLIFDHKNLSIWVNNGATVATGVSITDGLWHHIAVTWSASGALQLYKDGTLAFSTPNHQVGATLGNNGTLVLGQDQDLIGGGFDATQAFQGELDEVRIWSVVRGASQIAQSASTLLAGNEAGLFAYYRFNEGFGTNTLDSTGLGHNLTLRSGINWLPLAPYNPGTALDLFNGYAAVPHSVSLNVLPLTMTAWVRTTSVQPLDIIVSKVGDIQGVPNGYQLFLENGILKAFYFLSYDYRVDFRLAGPSAGNVNDGQWHHVAFVVDASGGKLFVDGGLRASRNWLGISGPVSNDHEMFLGNAGAAGFPGQLDELSLWNSALSQTGIQTVMGRRLTGSEANLLALYHFDEATGGIAYDTSGLGHHATLQETAHFAPSGALLQGLAQLRGRLAAGSTGTPNVPVLALLPPIDAPPLLPLLDNGTVTSANLVTLPGTLEWFKVNVNIVHPYRGDLELTLIHPDGTEVRLKDADGTDGEPNLLASYPEPTRLVANLAALNGKPLAGSWRLRVRDAFPLDSGVLNSWSLQFGPTRALTDTAGNYAFTNLLAGVYTVQPDRDGFVFDPAEAISPVDRTNVNFTLVSGFISGRVRDNTIAMGGVQVSAGLGFNATTDENGAYRLTGLPPGDKTLVASKLGYGFSPSQIPNLPLGVTGADFQVIGYPISGRITGTNSVPIAGVSVGVSTVPVRGLSDADGNYLIPSVLSGLAFITPSKTDVTFSPTTTRQRVGPALSNVNFVVIQSPPRITRLSDQVIARNQATRSLRFDVNDAETPPARLQVRGESSNTNLVPNDHIVFDGVGIQRTVLVASAFNQFGTAEITITVVDEAGLTASTTFSLRVNQLPLAGVGLALKFDGTTDVADGGLSIISDKGNYAVEAWAFAPSNAGPRTLVSQGGRLALRVDATGTLWGSTNWNTGVAWPFGSWHHVALVRESENTRLYLDGTLRASLGSALPQPSQSSPFRVGAQGTTEYWLGAIDELRVWRVARGASDISSNRLVRVTGNEPNLSSLWRFDEPAGSVALNAVVGGRNLAVSGATRMESPMVFNRYVTLQGRNINDVLAGYDADADPLTWSLVSPPRRGTITSLSSNSGAFSYTADGLGEDEFTFSVSDGYDTSQAYPVRIQVLPDTNAPSISFLADKIIAEDSVLGPLTFTVSDSEVAADRLQVSGQSGEQTLVPDENIVVTGNGTNRSVVVRPATNQFGTTTITLTVSDGSQEARSRFTLAVTPVNDAPVLSPLTNQVVSRDALNFGQYFTVEDVDTPLSSVVLIARSSDPLVASPFGNDPSGDAGVSRPAPNSPNAQIRITSSGVRSGTATITVTADDGDLITSRSHTVIVNDPPKIAAIPTQSTFRNLPSKPIAIELSDVDDPVGDAVVSASSSNPALVGESGFAFRGFDGNRILTITPISGRVGQSTITVLARDALGSSARTFEFFVDEGLDYTITDLGEFGGGMSIPTDINDARQVSGRSVAPNGYDHAFRWQDGQMFDLHGSAGFYGVGQAINSRGDVIGNEYNGTRREAVLYLAGGGKVNIGVPPGASMSDGWDINDAGLVAVYAGAAGAWIWNGAGFLPSPVASSGVVSINNAGEIALESSGNTVLLRLVNGSLMTAGNLGKFGGTASVPWDLNESGDVVGNTQDNAGRFYPFIYNFRSSQLQTNLVTAQGVRPASTGAPKINEAGEVVFVGTTTGIDSIPYLYTDERLINLNSLMPANSSFFLLLAAIAINNSGDIVGYGNTPGGRTHGFLMRRQWNVGQSLRPPFRAINRVSRRIFQAPLVEVLSGGDTELGQPYYWSDYEQRLFLLRPAELRISWFTSSELTNAATVMMRGRADWPAEVQIHVATAPVDTIPVAAGSPYRPVALSHSTVAGAFLDTSTRTFNAPGPGYSVIHYLLAPEAPLHGSPNLLTHSNYFEVVRTVDWNDRFFLRDESALVGRKVTDPRGPNVATNSFKSGWTIFPRSPYDGVGADRAYDRATQTGPIIPVNVGTSATDDDLVVAFYKQNSLTGVLWPDLPVRYSISWPTDVEPLVIANENGSGPLPEAEYPDRRIYVQANPNLAGYNPNEEHAFLAPTTSGQGVFALRNDLNRAHTSSNYVLLKYRHPLNREWQFRIFQPVLTDATHHFIFSGEAGQEISAPKPVGFLTICADTINYYGKAFRDHRGKFYASMGPTPADPNPQVVMRYSYALQPDFFYDLDGNGTNDVDVGQCVPWLGIAPGTALVGPVEVTNRIRWPDDAPTLQIGETLLDSKRGLPAIKDWASAQMVFDSLNPDGDRPLSSTARLYDPLSARTVRITNIVSASYQFPSEIALETFGGKQIFSGLPYYLRSRLSYDPVNKAISFSGFLDDHQLGEPLLLVNVISAKERLRILQLSSEENFHKIIEALYQLTRNPNGVNVAHPGQAPDPDLLIGFTTRYLVRVTNPLSPNDTSIQEFFGPRPTGDNLTVLEARIVQEPLGDAPKALTAGIPLPSASASFGHALALDGVGDFVSTAQLTEAPQTFTMSVWFKTTSTQFGGLLAFRDTSLPPSVAGDRDLYLDGAGALNFYIWNNGPFTITSSIKFNDGAWHHAAATFSAATGMRLYGDGNLVAENPNVTSAYKYVPGGYWRLGEDFSGTIDDVQIWHTARTGTEIQQGGRRPLTGGETGLLRYWRFDESNGAVAFDSTEQQADGLLQGNPRHVSSTIAASGPAERYVVLAQNNDPALPGLPVKLYVIRVDGGPFRGDLKIIPPDNVFDERLTLRHSSDFGADPDRLEFEWWYHLDDADFDPTVLPLVNADGSIANPMGWLLYSPALVPNKSGQNTITLGDGGETSQFTLADNWFISRYRGYEIGGQTNWSAWVGDPASAEKTRAALAAGWIKRVIDGMGPFEARTTNFHETAANTFAGMLTQAGERYEADIAFNPKGENLLSIGLIEAYTTVLNRGRSLSIDGLPPMDSDPLNNALLLAASRISDLYMLLGNEAFADAQDPTIGFFSDSFEFGSLATATFAFKNQLDSQLEEELALLRGRDDSAAGVGGKPLYNRLLWNFTGSEGEVAYERTYNVGDVNLDGVINENDARILFPQGHGDAWGHYLTALTTYYELLRHPRFTWNPRTEHLPVAGTAVRVDFLDERKFANAAAAKAKTGLEILDLTYRLKYVDDPEGQYQGYKDTRTDRAWGVVEWGRRAGQGAYFDWVVGNAILPSTDPNTNHTGIQKIDRQTVQELEQINSEHQQMQARLDTVDAGLNPLGLAKGAVPFDIDPAFSIPGTDVQGQRHFQQIYDRAVKAMKNCVTVWDQANRFSEALRHQQDDIDDFTGNVADQERDYKSRLIEIFGYPYAGDIGPGKPYPSGYDGPDLHHYMYVNVADISGQTTRPSATFQGFYTPLQTSYGEYGFTFPNDSPLAPNATVNARDILTVNYPTVTGDWIFSADASMGQRRAPGEIQLAISDLVQEQARLQQALKNYQNLVRQIQDGAELLNAHYNLNTNVQGILITQSNTLVGMNIAIGTMRGVEIALRRAATTATGVSDFIKDGIPSVVGVANDVFAPVRFAIAASSYGAVIAMETVADATEIAENAVDLSKETVQLQTEIAIETASRKFDLQQRAKELEQLIREEPVTRLEGYNQAELVRQAVGRIQAALAAGLRLGNDRTVFRQRTAALTQQNRYKDMAFRIFRNEALQKYRAQFDLAARYVYLAASAYDYELNFLGTDNRSGRDFFTDIIRQRNIGQMIDGEPIPGSAGLSDALGRLKQNFEVLESRFGLNNPQLETARFSLRKEMFRIRDDSDAQWRATLKQAVVADLWEVPEFRRYCRPFAPEAAGPQPGLVLRFPTTVTFGLNFFGFQLGGGDNAYDPSLFTTKINAVGVWFENYNSSGLAIAPRVYLIPAGMDVQRSPTGNTLATREWRVIDQAIPVPFPIGAGALTAPSWIPVNDSLAESFAQVRRFSSFRAYHDDGVYDDTQTTKDTRLIGRSVWNTDWILIIPGGTFLFDPEQGLETFINSVSDIKLSLQSYSYSGD